jgi:pyruvate formate lyase activating enzyme
MSARFVSLDEVVGELEEDMIFYRNSGGGVTLSGGEVLSQAPFAAKVLERLKTSGVHTIVETSGYGRLEDLLKIAAHADMFYYDFKLGNEDEFRLHTGGRADLPLGNLRALRNVTDAITLRVPLVPGITDTLSNVMAAYSLALSLDLRHVHLLPYNASASAKYEWIGKAFPLGELTPEPGAWERLKDAAPEGLEVLIQ